MQTNAKVKLREIPETWKQRKLYRWMVEARVNGKREGRKFYKHGSKDDAEQYAQDLEDKYQTLAAKDRDSLSGDVMEQAIRATKALAPWNASIEDAVKFFISHCEKEASRDSTTVSALAAIFLDEKERSGISKAHHYDLKCRLGVFEKSFGEKPLSMLERQDITDWLFSLKLSPQSQINYRRVIHNLFSYAIKRDIIQDNPVHNAAEIKIRSKKAVILEPAEVLQLLSVCDEKTLPAVALQVFCGVRATEAFRLDWQDIDFEDKELEVSEENAKRGVHQRIIPIPDCALAWLKPIAKRRGPIAPFNDRSCYVKHLQKIRIKAGWEKGTWPSNALRKTFISCHYETHGSIDLTAKNAGTSANVIHKTYRKLIKQREAQKLWKLFPGEQAEVTPIAI